MTNISLSLSLYTYTHIHTHTHIYIYTCAIKYGRSSSSFIITYHHSSSLIIISPDVSRDPTPTFNWQHLPKWHSERVPWPVLRREVCPQAWHHLTSNNIETAMKLCKYIGSLWGWSPTSLFSTVFFFFLWGGCQNKTTKMIPRDLYVWKFQKESSDPVEALPLEGPARGMWRLMPRFAPWRTTSLGRLRGAARELLCARGRGG